MKEQTAVGLSGLILACALLTTAGDTGGRAYADARESPARDSCVQNAGVATNDQQQPPNSSSGSAFRERTAAVFKIAAQSQSMTDTAALSANACPQNNSGARSSASAPAPGDAAAPNNPTVDPPILHATPPDQGQAPARSDQDKSSAPRPQNETSPPLNPEPSRILGVMPNFRAVSAGTMPPPPAPKQAFVIATHDSFDYSAYIFVGITSLLAEAKNTHYELGKGLPGFGMYYWRGFADKTTGNYLTLFALPAIFHQDERYHALGKGSFSRRLVYSATRVIIAPNYQGDNSFNASELLGRGISQAISLAYYPSATRTPGGFGTKFGYAIGRDVLANVIREFWPDIAAHVRHRHP